MNILYDIRLDTMLCPKCNGPADVVGKGNLQCEWDECNYVCIIVAEEIKVNIFQLELDF